MLQSTRWLRARVLSARLRTRTSSRSCSISLRWYGQRYPGSWRTAMHRLPERSEHSRVRDLRVQEVCAQSPVGEISDGKGDLMTRGQKVIAQRTYPKG